MNNVGEGGDGGSNRKINPGLHCPEESDRPAPPLPALFTAKTMATRGNTRRVPHAVSSSGLNYRGRVSNMARERVKEEARVGR